MSRDGFTGRVLRWYRQHGRHDLPWQRNRTLYRVWVAEIMLQQTRVSTVIPYYRNFMRSFPGLHSLARSPLDRVLECWAGLGYYSRARNLHQAAVIISDKHHGRFPRSFEQVLALPGIGRSTAGAILSQALGARYAILDGNVKRVLSRYHAVEGWPGDKKTEQQLWAFAERHTPEQDVEHYTQAIMDIGATLCTRTAPACARCPLKEDCTAYNTGDVARYPYSKPRKSLPVKTARLLLLTEPGSGRVMLEKRPPSGIWGGLWSLPETAENESVVEECRRRWGFSVIAVDEFKTFRHTFSHYHLDITPCRVRLDDCASDIHETAETAWYAPREADGKALASPVARILRDYAKLD